MERDIRKTPIHGEVEEFYRQTHEPGFGAISSAAEVTASPDGGRAAFTGSKRTALDQPVQSRICLLDLRTGRLDEITAGPNTDRSPRWSPDGSRLAFLSDRAKKGRFSLYLLESGSIGEARAAPEVKEATAEWCAWSPDGRSVYLGAAGMGADLAAVQGSGTTERGEEDLPSWMPEVDSGSGEKQWRRAYRYDPASGTVTAVSREGLNVWEAVPAGATELLAIVSESPHEDAWYSAALALIDVDSGRERVLYQSRWQLGHPAATPGGGRLAVVEAICSDRGVVAGDLLLIDRQTGSTSRLDTGGIDVTYAVWRDEEHLVFAGVRGLGTAVAEYDAASGGIRELWSADDSLGFYYPEVSPLPGNGFIAAIERYDRYPEIVEVRDGRERTVLTLSHAGADFLRARGGRIEEVRWQAPDGLDMQGLLVTPDGQGPFPLIVSVHGGPIATIRNRWMGSTGAPLFTSRGYAVFMPNPRGSTGRGQEFARMVEGDMGGADALDILSGIDALVERGIADPERIGVTGGSYGGFMSNWLVTQSDRFAAAIPMHPIADWYSQHGTSNIGVFDRLFLSGDLTSPDGQYFSRSPLMHAHRVTTPTLHIAGGKDRCTPPTQAAEFHRALLEHGVPSALVTYPEEGHGVRQMPAAIDLFARVLEWLDRYMPAQTSQPSEKEAVAAG